MKIISKLSDLIFMVLMFSLKKLCTVRATYLKISFFILLHLGHLGYFLQRLLKLQIKCLTELEY